MKERNRELSRKIDIGLPFMEETNLWRFLVLGRSAMAGVCVTNVLLLFKMNVRRMDECQK